MSTAVKGDTAEAMVLAGLVARGFTVLTPFGGSLAFDLGVHLGGGRFVRIQCKAARVRRGCLIFNTCSTDHGQGRRSYEGSAAASA